MENIDNGFHAYYNIYLKYKIVKRGLSRSIKKGLRRALDIFFTGVFMIENVLKNVRAAENEAELIKGEAESAAAARRFEADEKSVKMAEAAKEEARQKADAVISEAEKQAEENYKKVQSDCQKQCRDLKNGLEKKIDELAREVFGGIKNGCC